MDEADAAVVKSIADSVGVVSYIDRGRYIEAVRPGAAESLHIGRGYLNGFESDERIVTAAGSFLPMASDGRPGTFYVVLPSALQEAKTAKRKARSSTAASPRVVAPKQSEPRDYGVCDECFTMKTASGECACA